jgi:hypothetical protein
MKGKSFDLIGFLIHLLPSVLLLLLLIFTWKKPKIASIIFFTCFIIATLFFHTYKNKNTFMLISFPILISSILLVWVGWFGKQESIILWIARVIIIAVVVFYGLFALDTV